MNILFFTRRFYPLIGGVETHVLQISRHLVAKGHNITIVTEKPDENLPAFEKVEGIQVYRIPVGADDWFKKFRIWSHVWKLRELISKADVIHCHDVFFWYLPFRFLLWNKPVYTTFHGYETVYPPAKKAIFVRKISEKLSRGNICVGDFITKWYGTKSNYITYGGVEKVPEEGLKSKKIDAILQILFVGRLEKDTGSDIYLQTLDVLKSKKVAYNFQIYGDGAERKYFSHYGKVHGFTKDLQGAIASTDIVFASSYLSILQAMAHQKLVVAVYDNTLKEDYLKMAPFAPFIIIEKDPEKLAERITHHLEHPKEKEALVEKSYEWASKQSWEKVANKYIELWK